MIYLDSAAIVKLVHAEPESPALRAWLDERAETGWISSVLAEIESFRALARYDSVTIRSLDAIHLGTALTIRPSLTSFVTYDKRLLDAATAAGLPADSPA
jgi:predicted nucleic acid-binding protein